MKPEEKEARERPEVKKSAEEFVLDMAFIKVKKVPPLTGRIVKFDHGVQVVETDSREDGKRHIHCLGVTRIPNARLGDRVLLHYYVHKFQNMAVWWGRKVE